MNVLDTARGIMALCQPLTGERATGEVIIHPRANVVVPANGYLYPVVNGGVRHDLLFKTAVNPDTEDGNWPMVVGVPSPVQVLSNIGGVRHNMAPGTRFVIEQPWRFGLAERPNTLLGLAGAEDPIDEDLALWNIVPFESFGSKPNQELFRSSIGGKFPAAIIVWKESEPADGMSTSSTNRPTHRGAGKVSYTELFEILLICNSADSEHERRGQGLRVLQEMCSLLVDRQAVDGQAISSPGGLHIRKRYRLPPDGAAFYQAFQVYGITLSAQATLVQRDSRTYSPLTAFKIDAPREEHPTADDPDAEDLPLVVNNRVANPQ